MKTTLAFIITLMLAAISVSALAMPCAENAGALQEVRDSQRQVRLHVAQQTVTTAPLDTLRAHPTSFKAPGQISRMTI